MFFFLIVVNEKEAYYKLKERLDNLPEDWRPDIGRQLVQSASDYLDQHSLWKRLSPYSDWSSKAFGKDLDEFDRFFEEMHDSFVDRSTLMSIFVLQLIHIELFYN